MQGISKPVMQINKNIACVVTFHHEGIIANYTLRGIRKMIDFFEKDGGEAKLYICLDSADEVTLNTVLENTHIREDDIVIQTSCQDPGTSRNELIKITTEKYICICDGDDYYSPSWLRKAYDLYETRKNEFLILHPQYQVTFGDKKIISETIDMERHDYDLLSCLVVHPWVSSIFTVKRIFDHVNFCTTNAKKTGFGFEDWHWNISAVAEGYTHITVPETAHYYRRQANSNMMIELDNNAKLKPNGLFSRKISIEPMNTDRI